jgi:hypothetical protein
MPTKKELLEENDMLVGQLQAIRDRLDETLEPFEEAESEGFENSLDEQE